MAAYPSLGDLHPFCMVISVLVSQAWQLGTAVAVRKGLLGRTAEAHYAGRLRVKTWQLWKAYSTTKRVAHDKQVTP